MITEDYCSFEVAKLLKEKGFDEQCTYMYDSQHILYSTFEQCRQITRNNSDWIHYVGELNIVPIAAPTLQMAMKWLREVHKLYIEFVLNQDVLNEEAVIENYYFFNVSRLDRFANEGGDCKSYKSYEEACEAAIKYCLINLI